MEQRKKKEKKLDENDGTIAGHRKKKRSKS